MPEPRTAVVLAAGLGTRFLPLTRTVPKPAIPFLNRPILHWVFDGLRASGVEKAFVNLHHLPGGVREVAEFYPGKLPVEYSPEPDILGTAGLYNPLRDHLPEMFLAANADIWFDADLGNLIDDLDAHPDALATLAVLPRPSHAPYTGLDVGRGGKLRAFGTGPWFFSGLYAARREILDGLPIVGFQELVKDLLTPLLASGRIRAVPLVGRWADLGTPREYLLATEEILSAMSSGGGPDVPEGSRLEERSGFPVLVHMAARLDERARVTGPVVLGPGAEVAADADVGEAVLLGDSRVGPGAILRRAILSPSVVLHPHE